MAEVESAFTETGVRGSRLMAHGSVPLAEVLFAASASVTALAHLITVLRRQFKRGVTVDATEPGAVIVKADGSVPRGMVVIRQQSGDVEVRDAEGVAQAFLGAVAGTVSGSGEQRAQPTEPPTPGGTGA
ncbi:hypothetical protein ABT185_36815 [Streptomyces clavifer]|uniref:hypothetical protein n=1 Tax=Streptomyces clavifer TaxID=68188 RepID=UPI00332AA694